MVSSQNVYRHFLYRNSKYEDILTLEISPGVALH